MRILTFFCGNGKVHFFSFRYLCKKETTKDITMSTNSEQQKEDYGFVYILKNESMPGLIKIGITDNTKERLRTLNNTSVPLPFEASFVCKVKKKDMKRIEDALHKAFAPDRVNPKREFFRTEEERVIPVLSLFSVENVTDEVVQEMTEGTDPVERAALEREKAEAPRRRPTLNLYELGVGNGDNLLWKDDDKVFVTVASERKVIFNGELMSLTAATSRLKGLSYGIQPTPFWMFNGRSLKEIYDERYTPVDSDE